MINTGALIKERLKYLRKLKPLFRKTDGAIEAVERELRRILARKQALPEESDLTKLLAMSATIAMRLSEAVRHLEKGYVQ